MMKVLELRGYKSLKALNAFHTLMLGLKMLPAYTGEQYEEFYARIQKMDAVSQEKMIREAAFFVELQKDEVEAIICFCCDQNGVPYNSANIDNLGPAEMIEAIVAVCFKISQIKIDLVTPSEKKNLSGSA